MRLAFGVKARVGKDTAAQYFINTRGGVTLSFATPIYDIMHYAQRTCGFEPIKDRKFLQYVGTDWARYQNPDVWVNALLRKLRDIPETTNVFVTDLRFPNELAVLKKEGFKCVCITRNGLNETSSDTHTSENAFRNYDDFDYIIGNNESLEAFYQNLKIIV